MNVCGQPYHVAPHRNEILMETASCSRRTQPPASVTAYTQYPLPHRVGEALGDGSSTRWLENIPGVCIVKSACNTGAVVELVHAAGPINGRSASPTTTADSGNRVGRVLPTVRASAFTDLVILVDRDIGSRPSARF
jgi:hypothetical protein